MRFSLSSLLPILLATPTLSLPTPTPTDIAKRQFEGLWDASMRCDYTGDNKCLGNYYYVCEEGATRAYYAGACPARRRNATPVPFAEMSEVAKRQFEGLYWNWACFGTEETLCRDGAFYVCPNPGGLFQESGTC